MSEDVRRDDNMRTNSDARGIVVSDDCVDATRGDNAGTTRIVSIGKAPCSSAGRLVYSALSCLSEEYRVFANFGYTIAWVDHGDPGVGFEWEERRSADFVVIHPLRGCLVLRVVPGSAHLYKGSWYAIGGVDVRRPVECDPVIGIGRGRPMTQDHMHNADGWPMEQDPMNEAVAASRFIDEYWQEITGKVRFPLPMTYGVWLPESSVVPDGVQAAYPLGHIFISRDLERAEERISSALRSIVPHDDATLVAHAIDVLVTKVLLAENPRRTADVLLW